MSPRRFLAGCFLCLCVLPVVSDSSATVRETPAPSARPARLAPGAMPHSTSTGETAKAATDTFYLYGGPGTVEGRFQLEDGLTPDRQGWTGVDRTRQRVYWQVSDFNAANLNDNGPGNLAAWCGQTAAQQPGWATAPGYGNSWNQRLLFEATVSDPSIGQTVGLDLFFNHELEYGYDYFLVEYDSAGTWEQVFATDGSNEDASGLFPAPGVRYASLGAAPIVYAGDGYAGENGNQIRIRLRVTTDGAWSDQDGLWPTDAGAVQVDDITVTWSEGTHFTDFESGAFDDGWQPVQEPFAGDFSKVWPSFEDDDLDYCRDNRTPVMAFVDAGQCVDSGGLFEPPVDCVSTGGTTSPNWDYGVPGGWVVNYEGGLGGLVGEDTPLHNEVWSPEIDWDLPGTADDDPAVAGSILRFDLWDHLPFDNNIFYVWGVRSSADGVQWSTWKDFNFVYYGGRGIAWRPISYDVTSLIEPHPQKVQISLGVRDMAGVLPFPGGDATPSPVFDNVALLKYELSGPSLSTRDTYLASDGFPISGSIDASTPSARDQLDVPFDMASDVDTSGGSILDTGDSIICDVRAVIPGSSVADARMVWILDKNPLFEDAVRSLPSRAKDVNVVGDPQQWRGEVLADSSTASSGSVIPGRFFFDLPDEDFLYPGDVLRYYLQAADDAGRTSTLPTDLTGFEVGFENGSPYDPTFVVRALPSIWSEDGAHPRKLVWKDFGRGRGEIEWSWSMRELGFVEGDDFDSYTTLSPISGVSNGLGSAGGHGATAAQLEGYDTIVHLTANLSSGLLSDGSNGGFNDKSDDLGLLRAWLDLPGNRNVVHFGNSIFSAPSVESVAGSDYVQSVLGAELVDPDLRDDVDGQTAPRIRPVSPNFATGFVAFGGCPGLDRFDYVRPLPGAERGHGVLDPSHVVYSGPAASILHERLVESERKVAVSFPFGFRSVWSPAQKAGVSITARTELLRETFDYLGVASGAGVVSAPTLPTGPVSMAVHPNPFNPSTTVRFANLLDGAEGSVRVYNLRGELVRVLHDGAFGDRSEFVWDGTDANGASVASGVYLVEGRADSFRALEKIALVK